MFRKSGHDGEQPTRLERLAAYLLGALQGAGLARIAYSRVVRVLAIRLLLKEDPEPRVRVIVSGLGKGLKLRTIPGTPRSYWMGVHEPHSQAVLADEVRPGMTVYDAGAHIGYFSVFLARLVGPTGRVFAFEPSPQSLGSLCAAQTLNGFSHLVVVPRALWHQTGTIRLVRQTPGMSLVTDHVEGVFAQHRVVDEVMDVAAISLDDFVYGERNPAPEFIKIDVEGSEANVLKGARRLLSEYRPRLLLEVHGAPGREVWRLLGELNYIPRNIVTGDIPQTADEFAVWISQYLAVPT